MERCQDQPLQTQSSAVIADPLPVPSSCTSKTWCWRKETTSLRCCSEKRSDKPEPIEDISCLKKKNHWQCVQAPYLCPTASGVETWGGKEVEDQKQLWGVKEGQTKVQRDELSQVLRTTIEHNGSGKWAAWCGPWSFWGFVHHCFALSGAQGWERLATVAPLPPSCLSSQPCCTKCRNGLHLIFVWGNCMEQVAQERLPCCLCPSSHVELSKDGKHLFYG